MARIKKNLVRTNDSVSEEELKLKKEKETLLISLVDIVRKSRTKEKSDVAFSEIVNLLRAQIDKLVYRTIIPGHTNQDIEQEALFALRYKAIKDYDPLRSLTKEVSPFDKFAVLCMRRHLTTKRKASFQNKNWTLNSAKSLDVDRSKTSKSEESLFLADIIPQPGGDLVEAYKDKEYFMMLMQQLHSKLSHFEKLVLKLYAYHYSYKDIARIINKKYKKKNSKPIAVKSIDNALMRIKTKSEEVIDKCGDELDRQMLKKRREEREEQEKAQAKKRLKKKAKKAKNKKE